MNVMTATGQFKDANVQGLSYVSGGQSGVTNERGEFAYELHDGTPQDVTFSVGAVEIGTARGKSLITPVDLVPGGSTSSGHVQNIVRFLTYISSSLNPLVHIDFSQDILSLANTWPQVDFTLPGTEFEASEAMTQIISDVVSVRTDGLLQLPTNLQARSLLEFTLDCVYSGVYVGEVTGDHRGDVTIIVVSTGQMYGYMGELGGFSTDDTFFSSEARQAITYGQSVQFSKRIDVPGVGTTEITGRFPSPNRVEGTWRNDGAGTSGRFSGERIGGDSQDLYRYAGGFFYSDGALGYSVNFDADGRLTGRGYDGHRKTLFNIMAPAGTAYASDANGALVPDITSLDDERYLITFLVNFDLANPAITYNPTPTDANVLPQLVVSSGAGICRLN